MASSNRRPLKEDPLIQARPITPSSVSPKQPPSMQQRDWYPYYAGYTEAFAHAVLERHLRKATLVLDPWSGSGTTTATCIKRGISSIGVDINPALTVIARARLTPCANHSQLTTRAVSIVDSAKGLNPEPNTSDLLNHWLHVKGVRRIRAIQTAIHQIVSSADLTLATQNPYTFATDLPSDGCFFYCALFSVVRNLLSPFIASNPMWLKIPESDPYRILPSWSTLRTAFYESVGYFGQRLWYKNTSEVASESPFKTGDATGLSFGSAHFDAVLTSPPYATRMDYVKGMLPELAVLAADESVITRLRKQTTGSPVVKNVAKGSNDPLMSDYPRLFITQT